MKKRLLSIILAALMIVSLLPTAAFAKETGCTHVQKVTTITDGETYRMNLSGRSKGYFTFEASGKNWNIKNSDGKYLNVENGRLVPGSFARTAWTYRGGAFSTSVKSIVRTVGHRIGFFYFPGRTTVVTTTYYLSTVRTGEKLSTFRTYAELYKEFKGTHDYTYLNIGNGTHLRVCRNCGEKKTEACVYDPDTHRCVCGAFDPAKADVKISVDVKKTTTMKYVGFPFWGMWKNVTIYTATVRTEATGTRVVRVEYRLNGGRWTPGSVICSEKPIEKLSIRVLDSNNKWHSYEWPEAPGTVSYNVTAQVQGDHGTVTAKANSVDVTEATAGTSVVFEAIADEGYAFDYWEVVSGGIDIEADKTENPLTVTMPETALTVKAHFAKAYAVVVEANGHGTASADKTIGVSGDEVNLTITPDEGYEVDQINVIRGDVAVVENKFNIGTADVKIRVTFKAVAPSKYGIIVEGDGHGTLVAKVGDEVVTSAAPGTTVNLVATPDDGYQFKEWQVIRGGITVHKMKGTFTMPSNEVKVKAVFQRVYTIEVVAQGHGTATASDTKSIAGREITLTATPEDGYKLDHWEVERGGVTVGDNNKFNVGTADVKIKAVFVAETPDTYNIIVENDGHGTACANPTSAAKDAEVTLSATPSEGYTFKEWVDVRENAGDFDKTKAATTLTMPSNEIKVRAIFERVYNINIQTNEHGTASATVGGETTTTAAANAEVTLTATPAEGYQLKEWKVVSGDVSIENNKFTMPASNVTVQAVFEESSECIAAGTMISMPGGTQKAVEELEIGDVICTFDHETGEVSSAPVAFIWESKNVGNAFTLTFEDDIEVIVIEEHGFYDQEEQKYVFINLQNAEEYIGHHFYNADTNSWLELKSCEALNDSVDAYAIITSGHLNHMSNGMLSMCDGSVKVLANIFEYDNQMKFDADKKKADIEAYGLTSKEKIMEFEGFFESDYDDYNLQYLNVAIGKGLTTWEWIKAFSDYCVANGL